MVSRRGRNTAISAAERMSSKVTQLFRIFCASSPSPLPRAMEARAAPPPPTSEAKALTSMVMGKVTPNPANARAPVSGMWPT